MTFRSLPTRNQRSPISLRIPVYGREWSWQATCCSTVFLSRPSRCYRWSGWRCLVCICSSFAGDWVSRTVTSTSVPWGNPKCTSFRAEKVCEILVSELTSRTFLSLPSCLICYAFTFCLAASMENWHRNFLRSIWDSLRSSSQVWAFLVKSRLFALESFLETQTQRKFHKNSPLLMRHSINFVNVS